LQSSIETRLILLGEQEVPYLLKRSRRRSVGLHVDAQGLTVQAPIRASQKWLDSILREKSGWVIVKLRQMRERAVPNLVWQDGVALPFLGEELRLSLLNSAAQKPFLCNSELVVTMPSEWESTQLQKKIVEWYRSQAMLCFSDRLAIYADKLGLAVPVMKLSNATTRWGSCNVRGELRLSWRLIKAPLAQIDYVVAHELAHLLHLDHSAAFWRVVDFLYPDYQSAQKALRNSGVQYHTF
jgi:predicted metal-dependent hydrolase